MRACATKSGYYHFIIISLLRFQLKNIEKKLQDYRKHNTRSVPPREFNSADGQSTIYNTLAHVATSLNKTVSLHVQPTEAATSEMIFLRFVLGFFALY